MKKLNCVFALLAILVLVSCGTNPQPTPPVSNPPTPTPGPVQVTPTPTTPDPVPQPTPNPPTTTPTPVTPPVSGVHEIKVTARNWEFSPSSIEVKKGEKVRLLVTSVDVPHGFSVPEYQINERLDPGKEVAVEFTAEKTGEFTAFCSVFCGAGHSKMRGKIVVT